ncbi:hypothetical protein [Actinophytocola gossypii]|uniref:ABC transporter permease n=1 Tax=Actinophytocola gossypii TaxID=2812003 RepID=A0ABT2JJD4_9PSEU|nr:hypothetical protein [Actinophytocola gossypii]MCT2587998.1 hypothetical protein [Actinophytocola gossypii]
MKTFAARWLSGDERTLGLLLAVGVLTMAFFRLDRLRQIFGVASPEAALLLLLVAAALAWWSMLPRGFVWLEPAVLTWRDFGAIDRERIVAGRQARGWLGRVLALGYLLAVTAAVIGLSRPWVLAGGAFLLATALLALGATRRVRRDARLEALAALGLAAAAVAVRPGPLGIAVAAAVLVGPAVVLLARSGSVTRPEVSRAGRDDLVRGWRDRVLRVVGVQFLDVGMLLPAARPVRGWSLRRPTGVRLAWVGIAARARHVPTAALLAVTAVTAHLALPALPDELVFGLLGYLALVPLAGGLGELWRSPGRRRWAGLSDTALRAAHLLVLTGCAVAWALPVYAWADWDVTVLLTVPLAAACAVRTVTGAAPTYDNTASVDTPMGSMPVQLIARSLRGPDLGLVTLLFVPVLPVPAGAAVVAAAVLVAVLR